jgi:hypothetical protein
MKAAIHTDESIDLCPSIYHALAVDLVEACCFQSALASRTKEVVIRVQTTSNGYGKDGGPACSIKTPAANRLLSKLLFPDSFWLEDRARRNGKTAGKLPEDQQKVRQQRQVAGKCMMRSKVNQVPNFLGSTP